MLFEGKFLQELTSVVNFYVEEDLKNFIRLAGNIMCWAAWCMSWTIRHIFLQKQTQTKEKKKG